MITPITNNMNANAVSSIERPRVPRRMVANDSISFSGKGGSSKQISGVKRFFGKVGKAFNTAKKGLINGLQKTVGIIKSIPKAIGGFFKKITHRSSKKA